MGFRHGYVYVDGCELRRMPIQKVARERLIHTPTPQHIPSDMHRALFSYAASSGISKTKQVDRDMTIIICGDDVGVGLGVYLAAAHEYEFTKMTNLEIENRHAALPPRSIGFFICSRRVAS